MTPVRAGSSRARGSQVCPVRSWISAEDGDSTAAPGWLSSVWPSRNKNKVFLIFKWISWVSVCARCLSSCNWAPLRRAWLPLLYSPIRYLYTLIRPPEPPLLQAGQSQLGQALHVWQMHWSLYHLRGPLLDLGFTNSSYAPHINVGKTVVFPWP